MKFCSHCGCQLDDDAIVCPKCGCQVGEFKIISQPKQPIQETPSKAPMVLGILSVIFGALGGWAGLVLGIIGLSIDHNHKYRGLNITGIVLFGVWVIVYIIILISY